MAALEGLDLSVSSGDVAVAAGTLNGEHVAADTLDAAGMDDGDALVVIEADGTLALKAALEAGDTQLGTATVDTDAVTAVTYEGRGTEGYQPMVDPAFYVDPSSYVN